MYIAAWVAFAASLVCGVCRFTINGYIFSALISGFCGISAALNGRYLMALGLFASVVADWFLCHQAGHSERFLFGVAGFLVAHCLFAAYAFTRFRFGTTGLVAAIVLMLGFGAYMAFRALPHVPAGLKIPILAYTLVSIISLYAAFSMNAPVAQKILYIAGIAAIVFSDTMISENIFVGMHQAAKLVHPTYYACHWLIVLSMLIR